MKNKTLKTILFLLLVNITYSQTSKNSNALVKNEKYEEFIVSIYKGKQNFEATVEIKRNGEQKPLINFYATGQSYDFSNLNSASDVLTFEDFNFDGEKEIVIQSNDGIYLFDRKTGKPKNLFEKEKDRENGKLIQNYIFTYRGDYEKDGKEKTLKITGSCGAGCGVEVTYRAQIDGSMKRVRKCEWDY